MLLPRGWHCKLIAHATVLQRCLNVPPEKAANFRNFPGVKENVPKGMGCKGMFTHQLRSNLQVPSFA